MKVFIHPCVDADTRAKLERLLTALGHDIVDSLDEADREIGNDEDGGDAEPCEDEAPPCIVVLTPDLTAPELEPELTQAVARGCRIIGIWPSGADGNLLPLKDYGDDTVPWDAERINEAICGTPVHQAPDGSSMPAPKAKHGGC